MPFADLREPFVTSTTLTRFEFDANSIHELIEQLVHMTNPTVQPIKTFFFLNEKNQYEPKGVCICLNGKMTVNIETVLATDDIITLIPALSGG